MRFSVFIPTSEDFWKFICLFAYHRWYKPNKEKPLGVPGNRDPSNPCPAFAPVPKKFAGESWDDCETDGHYLCDACLHKKRNKNEHNS